MTSDRLTDKERAFLEAAKREAARNRPAPADPATGARAPRTGLSEGGAKAPVSKGAATPLDQPTVLGWDHPAANAKAPTESHQRPRVASRSGAERAGSAMTPLDQPTVLGWDNPAAQQDPAAAKWERVSRLIAEERETAEAERRKVKKYGLIVTAALFAAGMMVVLALWPKLGA
jgi:predicted component of type VI protein secretion system